MNVASQPLPEDIAALVWNYDTDGADLSDEVVIMAVLRLGTWDQIKWAFRWFGRDVVVGVIESDYFGMRTLPLAVRNFWGCVFWPDSPPPEYADPRAQWRPTRPTFDPARAVASRMAAALDATGLTQREFAALLGTSQSRLSSYITGKVVPSAALLVAAEHLAGARPPDIEAGRPVRTTGRTTGGGAATGGSAGGRRRGSSGPRASSAVPDGGAHRRA